MGRKRRVMKAKLDQFLEYIHSSDMKMSQEEYLQMVRSKVKECTKKDNKQVQTNYILEKICEICNDYHHDEQLLLCDYCDDAYHSFCLNPPLKDIPDEDEDWFCPVCVEQKYSMEKEKRMSGKRSNSKVQKLLESYQFKNKRDIATKIQICGKCDDMILYMENEGVIEESEKCIKCTKLFHKGCFSKKKDSILCTSCQSIISKQIPQTQKLIGEYFIKNQQQSQNASYNKKVEEQEILTKESNEKKKNVNNKMVGENKRYEDESNEILDVDAINEKDNMRTTRGRKAKILQQNQNQQKPTKKQQKSRREDDEEQTNQINDAFINSARSNQNITRSVLAKKRKKNDSSEFITNNKQGEDSLTQPLSLSQKVSSYNDDSESTTAYSMSNTDSSTNKNNNKNNNDNNKNVKDNYKGVKFLLPQPSSNPLINIQCKQSLIYALKAKNIQFCDDLSYTQSCTRADNNAQNEPNLQVIDFTNGIIFNKFKDMTRQGIYAPVVVEEDKIQGFIVRAMEDIKAKTLITEYVGEVDFARNHIFNKNDSIMDLLRTARSKTSLVILPDKKGNLARFLSGINNSSKKSMARQNVHSVRFNINGESHVILYAKKNIKKGELLYYDYNAGGFGEYPTQDFV